MLQDQFNYKPMKCHMVESWTGNTSAMSLFFQIKILERHVLPFGPIYANPIHMLPLQMNAYAITDSYHICSLCKSVKYLSINNIF